jgi:hypothetical protein
MSAAIVVVLCVLAAAVAVFTVAIKTVCAAKAALGSVPDP